MGPPAKPESLAARLSLSLLLVKPCPRPRCFRAGVPAQRFPCVPGPVPLSAWYGLMAAPQHTSRFGVSEVAELCKRWPFPRCQIGVFFLFAVRQFAHAQMFQDVYRARFLRHSGFPWPGGGVMGPGGDPGPDGHGFGFTNHRIFLAKNILQWPDFWGIHTRWWSCAGPRGWGVPPPPGVKER